MVSAKVRAAIMQKCTQEEVQAVLKEIPDDESDQAVATRVSTYFLPVLGPKPIKKIMFSDFVYQIQGLS